METNNKRRLGVVAGLASAVVAVSAFGIAAPASAEPVGAPTFRTLAGAGSDTTQDLNNGLSAVVEYNGQLALGSYNATNPVTGAVNDDIQTKQNGTVFDRPNGSGQGVSALRSAKDTTTVFRGSNLVGTDLQFARSSSAAAFSPDQTGAYSYIPLALDAVTYATGATSGVPSDLSVDELSAIYSANNGASVTIDGQSYVVGIESNASADIHPFIPQSGSGTRSFWLGQLGLAEGTFGTAVRDAYSGGSVQEHDGSVIADVDDALVPFSIAQHIAQGNADALAEAYDVTVADRREGAVLRTIDGVQPLAGGALNTAFPVSRPVFTVVSYAELQSNAALSAVFEGSGALAYEATRPGSTELTVEDFGFGDITGGVTIGDVTYTAGDAESFRVN